MDVYLKDENRVINVEMQTTNKGDLPPRARYYQAAADIDTTPKGSEYKDLKQNYVIFICTFDPFNRQLPRYTFQYTCNEEPKLKLKDGSLRIFLNTTSNQLSSLDQNLQAFYHYLQMGVVESDLAQTISASITTLKNNSLERRHYMTWAIKMADARYDGYDEGFEKGITTGREEGISIGLERGAYQNKLETAQLMIELGIPLEQVQLCTNLSLDVVQSVMESCDTSLSSVTG